MSQRVSEREVRIAKIDQLKSYGVVPYANRYDKVDMIGDLLKRWPQNIEEGQEHDFRDVNDVITGPIEGVKTAGRLVLFRSHGKISFGRLQDETGQIQVMFHRDVTTMRMKKDEEGGKTITQDVATLSNQEGEEMTAYKMIDKLVDVGDWIGVEGELFYTHKGELTLLVSAYTFLSKAIESLGDKFHGIGEGQETAYRQRYLDMIHNSDTVERFKLRSAFIRAIREFYRSRGFMEIETPILGTSASGAAAKPFVTHHEDFDLEMYLHIAPETSLKKATVGGLEKVFEFSRNFRNEGSSPAHHQEFTAIEHYAVYRNYEDNMKFMEEMFDHLFGTLPQLSRVVEIEDKQGVMREVDFSTPWERIDYISRIQQDSGIDVSQYGPADEDALRAAIREQGHEWTGLDTQTTATMIDYLYKKVTRPSIVGPAFIYNYPKTMQPLARTSDADDQIVEQFQVIVNGWEICKAYSELVNPLEQQENFDAQGDALARGDEEATKGDDEFVRAMEYGMPPQSGRGMGIDRVFAMLTEQKNIRDVIMFPMMKPENSSISSKEDSMVAVALINRGLNLLPWQEMNTVAHLNAAWGARLGSKLFSGDSIETADGEFIKLNVKETILIKEIGSSRDVHMLISEARDKQLTVTEFTREMIDFADDEKIIDTTRNIDYDDIDHLGILIYGPRTVVDDLTKQFSLYEFPRENITDINQVQKNTFYDGDYPSVEVAQQLADTYLTDTRRHCEQVGQVMRAFAIELGLDQQEQDRRYITGVLHDIDRDHIAKDANRHLQDEFDTIMDEIDAPELLREDIRSHGEWLTGVPVDTTIRKYLASVDELSGFLYAYSLMRPTGFEGMAAKGIKKRLKDKKFAAGIDREHVRNCEQYLGVELGEFALKVAGMMSEM